MCSNSAEQLHVFWETAIFTKNSKSGVFQNILSRGCLVPSCCFCVYNFQPSYSPVERLDEIEKFIVDDICVPIMASKTMKTILGKLR